MDADVVTKVTVVAKDNSHNISKKEAERLPFYDEV
jgi:hypothetical protein